NHPFLTLDGWKQLESLRVGDRIAAPRKLHIDLERSWPVHELVVLGGLLSEGNTCHPNSLYFFNNRRDVIEDFAAAANRFPDTVARIDVRTNGALEVCVNRGGRPPPIDGSAAFVTEPEHPALRCGAFLWAHGLGLLGKKATQKSVPSEVFKLRDSDLALLLGRLWTGDGFICGAG